MSWIRRWWDLLVRATTSFGAATQRVVTVVAEVAFVRAHCARLCDMQIAAMTDLSAAPNGGVIECYVSRREYHWGLVLRLVEPPPAVIAGGALGPGESVQLTRPVLIHIVLRDFGGEKRWVVCVDPMRSWSPKTFAEVTRSAHRFTVLQLLDVLVQAGKSFGVYQGLTKNCESFATELCALFAHTEPNELYAVVAKPALAKKVTSTEKMMIDVAAVYGFCLRIDSSFHHDAALLKSLSMLKSQVRCVPLRTYQDESVATAASDSAVDEDEQFDNAMFESTTGADDNAAWHEAGPEAGAVPTEPCA